ncbi:MAG: hypothetical protein ACKOJF_01065, partial [Planctomycetaceae bacterium]
PIQPWFDQVQSLAVPVVKGHVDMVELGRRPGLGVELNMELVKSRGHIALAGLRYVQVDGATPLH